MQDAIALAWRLAQVVRGEGALGLLDSYSAERSAVGDMVLRDASHLTTMATLTNPAVQAARNLAIRVLLGLPAVRQKMATQMSETAGVRLAPVDYDGPPPGAGRVPRFVLYAAERDRATRLLESFAPLVEPRVRKPLDEHGVLISRPDGYVGFAGGENAWGEAESYLQRCARSRASAHGSC